MKTILVAAATLVGFGLVGMIAIGGVLASAYQDATTVQRPVIDAIVDQDTQAFLERCTPELRASIDEPVLLLWMQSVNEVLGDRRISSESSFHFDTSWDSGHKVTTTDAKIPFEKGHADVQIVAVDDMMDSIDFSPSRSVPRVNKRPHDISVFEQRGREVLMDLASPDPSEALAAMHTSLQELLPAEALAGLNDNLVEAFGEITSIEPLEAAEYDDQSGELKIRYEIHGHRGSVVASASFVFQGLRGQVIGFDWNLGEVRSWK